MSMGYLLKPTCGLIKRAMTWEEQHKWNPEFIRSNVTAFINIIEAKMIHDYLLRYAVINEHGFLNREMAEHFLQGHDSEPVPPPISYVIDDARMTAAMNALMRAAHPSVEYINGNELHMAQQAASVSAKSANEAIRELEMAIPGWFAGRKNIQGDSQSPVQKS